MFKRDTLARRLAILYALALAVVLLGGALIISTAVWPNYQRLEERESGDRLRSVMQAVQAERDRLAELVNTNAVWEDAYLFTNGANPTFAEDNFNPEALAAIGVDSALVLTNEGEVLFAGGRAHEARAIIDASLGAARRAPGLQIRADEDAKTALITIGGDIVMVSSRRVVHTDGTGPSPGTLLFARRMGADLLSRMRDLTGAHFSLTTNAATAAPQNVRAHGSIADAYGAPSIAVSVLGEREVLALGASTIATLVLATALMLAALAGAFALAMMRNVIAPVTKLVRAVETAAQNQSAFATPASGSAEIGDLGQAFNAALAQVRDQSSRANRALASKAIADKANAAKSQFIANISHELRTPLNAVIGYGELLRENAVDDGREADIADLDRILAAAQHLLSLINAVLDFSKLEAGRIEADMESVEIAPIVRVVAELMAPAANAKGVDLRVEIEDDHALVVADAQKLKQCLINLAGNAVKFTSTGAVTLRTARNAAPHGGMLRLTVIDTGIGIERGALAHVFEPFSQADNSITRRYGGTGLGLAITRDLVRLMGGRIGVASKVGEGSRFIIDLPAAPRAAANQAAA